MGESYVVSAARAFSARFAQALGIAEPPDAWRAFYAQIANETATGDPSTRGVRNNNPLNLTDPWSDRDWAGQVGNDEQFAIFGSLQSGIDAAVNNYLAPNYAGVQRAFASGDTAQLVRAIEESPWDAGHYSYQLERLLPSAPATGDPDCPRGWSKDIFGVCVPFATGGPVGPVDNAVKAATDAAGAAASGIPNAISRFGDEIARGSVAFASTGVMLAAVAVLGYMGIKRVFD